MGYVSVGTLFSLTVPTPPVMDWIVAIDIFRVMQSPYFLHHWPEWNQLTKYGAGGITKRDTDALFAKGDRLGTDMTSL